MSQKFFLDKLRFYLTNKCNGNCSYCFNKDLNKDQRELDLGKFKKAAGALSKWGCHHIAFLGGEPLMHNKLLEIYQFAQVKFTAIKMFTNGTIALPRELKARPADIIVFNFSFLNSHNFVDNVERTIKENKFKKVYFNILIGDSPGMDNIKKGIEFLSQELVKKYGINHQKYKFYLSLDCMDDILAKKDELNKNLIDLIFFLRKKNLKFKIFQHIPQCFFSKELKLLLGKMKNCRDSVCRLSCFGVFDVNFNISSCGLFYLSKPERERAVKKNFFKKNGETIDFDEFKKAMEKAYQEKIKSARKTECLKCGHWGKDCNGGCFLNIKN